MLIRASEGLWILLTRDAALVEFLEKVGEDTSNMVLDRKDIVDIAIDFE